MNDTNILIVGVGGQGTLLASRVVGQAALASGRDVKVSEVHGMSQRGGSVVTYVRFGDRIDSPLIGKGGADILLSFELLESLRFQGYLRPDGRMIVNTQIIDPMPVVTGAQKYPDDVPTRLRTALGSRAVLLDAADIARGCGDLRAVNTVLIGVMAGMGAGGIERSVWEEALRAVVPPRALEVNRRAFAQGYERGESVGVL